MDDTRMTPIGEHLDLLRLDALRAGEGTAAEEAHVGACPACAADLAELEGAARALREAQPPSPPIPPQFDAAILKAYREHFRPQRTFVFFPVRRAAWRWAVPAAGVAAAAALVIALFPGRKAEMPPAPPSGTVTILDAFRLAREIESRHAPDRRWDANGDGRVDRADVDALARRAVAL